MRAAFALSLGVVAWACAVYYGWPRYNVFSIKAIAPMTGEKESASR